jgi:hypothetical protein
MSTSRNKGTGRRSKRELFVRWLQGPPFCAGGCGAIEIFSARESQTYRVKQLQTDFGKAGFELVKVADKAIGAGSVYHVLLDGRRSHCDCIGCEQHGHCKHVKALLALLDAGFSEPGLPIAIQCQPRPKTR